MFFFGRSHSLPLELKVMFQPQTKLKVVLIAKVKWKLQWLTPKVISKPRLL